MKHNILTSNTSKEDLFRKYSNPLLERAYKKAKGLLVEEDGVLLEEDGKPEGGGNEGPKINVESAGEFIELENLVRHYADGTEIKSDKIYLMKDVFRKDGVYYDNDKSKGLAHESKSAYDWTIAVERLGEGMFLPDSSLLFGIVVALFDKAVEEQDDGEYKVLNQDLKDVLDSFKDYGSGHGYHACNSIFDIDNCKIIHNPSKEDYPDGYNQTDINKELDRKELSFDKELIGKWGIDITPELLKKKKYHDFIMNYTGEDNLEILFRLGRYFDKQPRLYISSSGIRAGWFGCYSGDLYVDTGSNLDDSGGARGVCNAKNFPSGNSGK